MGRRRAAGLIRRPFAFHLFRRVAHFAGRITFGLRILERRCDLALRQVAASVAVILLAGASDVDGLGLGFLGALRLRLLGNDQAGHKTSGDDQNQQ